MKARMGQVTPEVEAYRDEGPLKKWLDSKPEKREERRRLLLKRLGISKAMLHLWINGSCMPHPNRLLRLCAIIGCSAGKYLEWLERFPTPEGQSCEQGRSPASV